MIFIMVFAAAFLLSLVFTPAAIRLAPKIGAVDIPKDNRRMHTKPMPRFGGMAIFIGCMAGLALAAYYAWPMLEAQYLEEYPGIQLLMQPVSQMKGVLAGGVLIYIIGVIDDLKNMPAKVKFLGQVVVACVAYAFGVRINYITNHFGNGFGDTHSYLFGA
ncbi:MAG: hypothetical protein K6F52_03045, partial [Clostridia bacterium]|nr:hypothetical protein [Clostridia bacterium]